MLFMVVERFKDQDMLPAYKALREGGRMLPERLKYLDSWVEPNFARCFQLMERDDLRRKRPNNIDAPVPLRVIPA